MHWPDATDLPTLRTDEEKLRTILRNLLENACKYTRRGMISIGARWNRRADELEIDVSDTGVGIEPGEIEAIFEAFRQGGNRGDLATAGVGLGLYIVQRLASRLGGEVRVDSTLGLGSTFTVCIPRLLHRGDAVAAGEPVSLAMCGLSTDSGARQFRTCHSVATLWLDCLATRHLARSAAIARRMPMADQSDLLARGREVTATLWGDLMKTAPTLPAAALAPDFFALVTQFVFGMFWSRPNLDLRSRSLCTVAQLAALGKTDELKGHLVGRAQPRDHARRAGRGPDADRVLRRRADRGERTERGRRDPQAAERREGILIR